MNWLGHHHEFFNYLDDAFSCPLSRAIRAKDMNTFKRILEDRKVEPIPLSVDNRGWTALHVAASNDRYEEYLKLLFEYGDYILLQPNAITYEGETAFHIACEKKCTKNCFVFFENRFDPKLPKFDMSTALHAAASASHDIIIPKLIELGLDVNAQDEWQRYTALHLAVLNGELSTVKELMKIEHINVSLMDEDKNYPLHLACQGNYFEIVKLLLHADHNMINSLNVDGYTPIMLATQKGNPQLVEYLLDHGANPNLCTKDGIIMLQYAALSGNTELLKVVLKATDLDCIRKYCLNGISSILSTCEKVFPSLLSCVIKSGSSECMAVLLESNLPRSILEAPYVEYTGSNRSYSVYSPLAYLFSLYADETVSVIQKFLNLLLNYKITHMEEFNKEMLVESNERGFFSITSVHLYVHPFDFILDLTCNEKRFYYLNLLLKYGINFDYCFECYYKWSKFHNDRMDLLHYYYPSVEEAIKTYNIELISLALSNSVMLEPENLWPDVNYRLCSYAQKKNDEFIDYLMKLCVKVPSDYNHLSNELMENISLQKLCRSTIRNHLRNEAGGDTKIFKQTINDLPIPGVLKKYLMFK